jgi:YHS domain-containing protein
MISHNTECVASQYGGNEMVFSSDRKKIIISALLTVVFLAFSSLAVFATEESNPKVYGVAIKGYDPVAYFTDNRAVKGKSEYAYDWNEASWYFSTPENRDLFAVNPKKYAPNHGGF